MLIVVYEEGQEELHLKSTYVLCGVIGIEVRSDKCSKKSFFTSRSVLGQLLASRLVM